jgi:glycosyltransferase involved in cell wall biosynthesis
MRVVIATPLYPPEIGGPATYAKLLYEGLPGKDIEVEVVKFSDVRHLPKFIRHYVYYRHVLRAARSADAILALDPVSVGLPALKAAQKAGKPFVVKIVGDYAWEQGQQRFGVTENLDEFVKTDRVPVRVKMLRAIQTRVAQTAIRVIVPSEYLKHIVMAWGIPDEHIDVIYNAITLPQLGNVPEAVMVLKPPLVVTAGRLVPWKHMTGVIEAVASLRAASLVIVGDGPDRVMLEQLAQKKLPGRHVFTGMVSHKDTLAVLQRGDVFVLNSSYEGLSHMLVEASMLGVPTIATRVGGNPEVITHEHNGILIPANDTRALTDALSQLLNDTELRLRLTSSTEESAQSFSTETMLSRLVALLEHL